MSKASLLVFFALLASCATERPANFDEEILFKGKEAPALEVLEAQPQLTPDPFLGQEQLSDLEKVAEREPVQNWIRYFVEQDKERFERFLNRGQVYKKSIEKVLRGQNLPTSLFYVALIESGFMLHASSHAGAVGPWQFIRGTGRRFGLKINRYVDERSDPMRSTEAAARYLGALHKVFNSWFLSLAAYNAGESRVMNAILNTGTRDFWELSRLKALPPETRDYVPKFLAAMIISSNPRKYNLEVRPSVELAQVAIEVPSPVSLPEVARHARVDLATLKALNPHLLRNMTSPFQNRSHLWFPKDAQIDPEELGKIKPDRKLARESQVILDGPKYYMIKKGDTLFEVARKFSTKPAVLRRLNDLKSNRIKVGQKIKLPAAG